MSYYRRILRADTLAEVQKLLKQAHTKCGNGASEDTRTRWEEAAEQRTQELSTEFSDFSETNPSPSRGELRRFAAFLSDSNVKLHLPFILPTRKDYELEHLC